MPRVKKVRKSLSIRLQPSDGTPSGLVADYLNSLDKDEFKRKVNEALVAFFYPYALNQKGCDSEDSLNDAFLVSQEIASKHFCFMALALRLNPIVFTSLINPGLNSGIDGDSPQNNHPKVSEEFEDNNNNVKASEVSGFFDF